MHADGRTIGVLVTGRRKELVPSAHPLNEGDVETLTAIAGLIANVVQNTMIQWGAELGLGVDYTEDVTQLSHVNDYKAVLFISTSRDALWNAAATTQNEIGRAHV